MSQALLRELGWQPDMPDWRDWTPSHSRVAALFNDLPSLESRPKSVNWRDFCPPIEPESEVPSSTRACVDLLEHCERRIGQLAQLSDSFVHHNAGRLAQTHAGNELSLRVVWRAITRFGAPTANVWPRPERTLDPNPDAFAYLMARSFANLVYIRLDARGQSTSATLESLRSFLAAGFPFVFGFPHYSSISPDGQIAFPTTFDTARGGHAVMAVGYDDELRLRSDRGCFQVRGQWGPEWGENGYGWLPYSYIRKQLATDFWTAISPSWLPSGEFRRPPL